MSNTDEDVERRVEAETSAEATENTFSLENDHEETPGVSVEHLTAPIPATKSNNSEEPDISSPSGSNTNTAEQFVYTVDDIEVEFDFNVSAVGDNNNEGMANMNRSSSNSVVRTDRSSINQRRRRRSHTLHTQSMILPDTFSKNWCLGFFSGIFTGIMFFAIGVVFVIYFDHLPNYIGVLFILVSLPPCCLSFNKLRTARDASMQRQRAERRRSALRHLHDEARGNDSYRNRDLPYSDHPPAYNNLAFANNEFNIVFDSESESVTTSSNLPSYQEAINLKKLNKENNKKAYSNPSMNAE